MGNRLTSLYEKIGSPRLQGGGGSGLGGCFAFISPGTANLSSLSEDWAGGVLLGTRNLGLRVQD